MVAILFRPQCVMFTGGDTGTLETLPNWISCRIRGSLMSTVQTPTTNINLASDAEYTRREVSDLILSQK